MPCDEMRERLSPYLEGELGESERRALEAHLKECADCTALLAVLRESVASLRAMPEAEPPAHLARKIQQAVAERAAVQSRPRATWGWTWMPAFAAAASFLAMIGL
ncbi:MAG: zf-HC2 domain-containing protein, partial [Nitrospirae bacterium]|nr:zf-HC2 domain-containing protein [Nitrospirota bacterium]